MANSMQKAHPTHGRQPLQPGVPLAVLCAAKGLDDWLSCNGNIWAVGRILDKLIGKGGEEEEEKGL